MWRTKHSEADQLLGKAARPVLDQDIELLRKVAQDRGVAATENQYPPPSRHGISDWEMLIINPVFKVQLEVAREYLLSFCQELDAFRDSLGKLKKRKFVRILTFEFWTV